MEEVVKIHLTKDERFFIRRKLILMMGDSPKFSFVSLLKPLTYPVPALLVAALLIGGGTSFAAEAALPGDILYSVKVRINEEVRALVSVSNESKANWEAQRAGRRLQEAETLADEGKLDINTSIKLEENFGGHAQKVHDQIEILKQKQNYQAVTDVSSNFKSLLKAHEKVISGLADKESELEFLHEGVRLESDDMSNSDDAEDTNGD